MTYYNDYPGYSDPRGYDPYYYNRRMDDRYPRMDDRYPRMDDRYGPPRFPRREFKRRSVFKGTEEERKNSTCLYVGNLPYNFQERDG